MSRIGKLPIAIPKGVKVQIDGREVRVEGPKGKLAYCHDAGVTLKEEDGHLVVARDDKTRDTSRVQGLARALIHNMVVGVSAGFKRELDIVGVGYRAEVKNNGKTISLSVGHSHPVELAVPAGIEVAVEKNTHIVLTGFDKHALGQFAANVREIRPPEPYKGKGIKYTEETVARKEGKKQG